MNNIKQSNLQILLAVALLTSIFTACTILNPVTHDKGVVINDVLWATRNVDEPGTFATASESAGKFYQWSRNKAWATTGTVTDWNSTDIENTEWTEVNDPSPAGWRVPTIEEIATLFDDTKVTNERIIRNGVIGWKFTDITTKNTIFFPAVGMRGRYDKTGGVYFSGEGCNYWSNTADVGTTRSYGMCTDGNDIWRNYNKEDIMLWSRCSASRQFGQSIRCVAKNNNIFFNFCRMVQKNHIEEKNIDKSTKNTEVDLSENYNIEVPPDTFHIEKTDIVYYDDINFIRESIRDSIENPKAYIFDTEENGVAIAIEDGNRYVTFSLCRYSDMCEYGRFDSYERKNINNKGNEELIVYWSHKTGRSSWNSGYSDTYLGIHVWDVDSYKCLLDFNYEHEYLYWWQEWDPETEDLPYEERETIDNGGESECFKYNVELGTETLNIQDEKDEDCTSINGKKYFYKLTGVGFVRYKTE